LQSLVGRLSSENLLYFYARFKQAKFGPCNIPKPGLFDFQGKQKWSAWKGLGEMSKDEAMKEYVEKLEEVDPGWQEDDNDQSSSSSSKVTGWVTVSSMVKPEEDTIDDEQKTICDWIKEGDENRVRAELTDGDVREFRDEDGLGLVHWAADRGDVAILKLIAAKVGFEVNLRDAEGQTALHYACSNGHREVVEYLLSIDGVDVSVKDNDGVVAKDNIDANDQDLLQLFPSSS